MKKRHKNRDKNNTWFIYLITILISIRLRQFLFFISKVFKINIYFLILFTSNYCILYFQIIVMY